MTPVAQTLQFGQFTPADFAEIIAHVPADCPIVGGQAVSFWAAEYDIKVQVNNREVDVTSKDIDFWGSRDDLNHLAKALHLKARYPHQYEMTVWVGAIDLSIGGKQTLVEFLHTVPGLDQANSERVSIDRDLDLKGTKKTVRVFTPVSMAICKLHNLRHFDQTHRNDEMHLHVCLQASARYIAELIERLEVREALWNCERLISTHELKATAKVEKNFHFTLLTGIPISDIRTASTDARQSSENRARLENFLTKRWNELPTRPR